MDIVISHRYLCLVSNLLLSLLILLVIKGKNQCELMWDCSCLFKYNMAANIFYRTCCLPSSQNSKSSIWISNQILIFPFHVHLEFSANLGLELNSSLAHLAGDLRLGSKSWLLIATKVMGTSYCNIYHGHFNFPSVQQRCPTFCNHGHKQLFCSQ